MCSPGQVVEETANVDESLGRSPPGQNTTEQGCRLGIFKSPGEMATQVRPLRQKAILAP